MSRDELIDLLQFVIKALEAWKMTVKLTNTNEHLILCKVKKSDSKVVFCLQNTHIKPTIKYSYL